MVLVLDCSAGTLTVYKSSKGNPLVRLGVAATDLSGEFCCAVALNGLNERLADLRVKISPLLAHESAFP
jgi:hypothetical protein